MFFRNDDKKGPDGKRPGARTVPLLPLRTVHVVSQRPKGRMLDRSTSR